MAGRASWKGYLKLSLVSCPVKLYPATSTTAGKISFNLLHKDTLNRVQQKYHDPELGEIDRADLVKGYQFEKDKYVVVTAEELDEIEIESSKTVDIDGFRLTTLRSAKEVREPSSALDKLNVKFSDDMLAMASQIIAQKPMHFAPEAFEDRYEEALLTLVRSKISGGQPVITKAPERGNVVNLMDALRRSIEEERRPPAPSLGKAAGAVSGKAPAKKPAVKAAAVEPAAKKKKSSAA